MEGAGNKVRLWMIMLMVITILAAIFLNVEFAGRIFQLLVVLYVLVVLADYIAIKRISNKKDYE